MTLIYKYKTVNRPDGTTAKCPCIPAVLSGSEERLETVCILDSGAETCTIPLEVAEVLGLELSEPKDAWGVGGRVESYSSKMTVLVKGERDEKYCFVVPVYVIDGQFTCLIGRASFFNRFVITIDEKNQRVKLKRNSRKP